MVLLEGQRRRMPFGDSWRLAIAQISPPRGSDPDVVERLAAERQLLGEIKPALRAMYEGRLAGEDEREEMRTLADQRLEDLQLEGDAWREVAQIAPPPPAGLVD